MKKFAVTAFALLYPILVLCVSAERSNTWAVREADALAHPVSPQQSHGFGKTEKIETHLSQTKLLESGFEVELPREAVAPLVHSERYVLPLAFEALTAQRGRPLSSRAPPSHA